MTTSFPHHQTQNRKGFTLIELILVIGIITIVAGVVIVAVAPRKNFISARDSERSHASKQVSQAIYARLTEAWEMPSSIPEGVEAAKPICRYGVACPSSAVGLDMLPPEYITSLPIDVTMPENSLCTGYMVYQEVGRPIVFSPNMGKLAGDDPAPESDCGGGATCGNGTQDVGEQCDDGDQSSGDGCDATCNLEAISPVPVTFKDNGDWGYSERCLWSNGVGGSWRNVFRHRTFVTGVGQRCYGAMTIGITPAGAQYEVYATWAPDPSNGTNAPVEIFNGATLLGTVTINERNEPQSGLFEGRRWQSLGTYLISTAVVAVRIFDEATDGRVVVDGIVVVPR